MTTSLFNFTAHIDESEVRRVLEAFNLDDAGIQRAVKRAIRKVAKRVKSRVAASTAKEVAIPKRVLDKRLKTYDKPDGLSTKVWLGLNVIPVRYLGNPRQTRSGVRVGRHSFPGAFVMQNLGIQTGRVYRRTTKKKFPLETVSMEIYGHGETAMRREAKAAERYFLDVLTQELNYELQKRVR